jgi:hypothetical protein
MPEHKNSAIRFLANRMNTYPISANNKRKEWQHIETILINNNYPQYIHKNNKRKLNKNTTNNTKKEEWTFTYIGKETRIAKLFRNTDMKIAYRTTNTIENHLREKRQDNIYNKSGMYQLKCGGCPKKYVGQTGRNFQTRYKEHIQSVRSNNSNSRYEQHLLESQHSYGPLEDTMVLHLNKKGQLMIKWEQFHIYPTKRTATTKLIQAMVRNSMWTKIQRR